MATVYTLGHSTRELADFSAVLQAHEIQVLVDIRAFPMSKRLPHFNRERLELWLPEIGIEYRWMQELGGRRKKILTESPNIALRNDSFRNYADYMLTEEFQSAAGAVAEVAESHKVAIMCAERMYFQCHRMLVSDYLTAHGHHVLHIENEKRPREHKMMDEARVVEGKLIYRGDRLL
ncbi:MAG: hypothetical protein JWO20_1383 [Candidatus Angelobacter sp.]|jgi:uncharacterized protein (DUF488 family)|nr:hypothetical protein [Candidatus Angelobacter sp.]